MSEPPGSLTVSRHVELRGRGFHPWVRRGLLALVAVLPVLALLDVFGQRMITSSASGPAASLQVSAPSAARGGNQFTARFEIRAVTRLAHPQLVLEPGWFDQVTSNGAEPQASNESSKNGRVVFSYSPVAAGQRLIAWLSLQINPTDVARRVIDVELADSGRPIARVRRRITIFP
jgi:hypothetical protein